MNRREMIGGTVAAVGVAAIKPPDIEAAQAAMEAGFRSVPQPWRERARIYMHGTFAEGREVKTYAKMFTCEPAELADHARKLGQGAAEKLNALCDEIAGPISVSFLNGAQLPYIERIEPWKGGKIAVMGYYDVGVQRELTDSEAMEWWERMGAKC